MGAVNFSIDAGLVTALKRVLPFDVFVETGTFHGDTIDLVKDSFRDIYSVELSQELFNEAKARFEGQANVHLIQGDSGKALAGLSQELSDRSVLYYLDAHWCVAENTAGNFSQCPLLDEIRAIGRLNPRSVVIIDDARLFLAPPTAPHDISQWPGFSQILHALESHGVSHRVLVLNDNILFVPESVESDVRQYAHDHGIDWLAAMTVFKQHEQLWSDLTEKEKVIQEQARSLAEAHASLVEKERVLHMHAAISSDSHRVIVQKEQALADSQVALAQKERALADTQAALARKELAIADLQASRAHVEEFIASTAPINTVQELERKEAVIQELSKAIKAYRTAHFVLSPRESWVRICSRLKRRLVRLGSLNHHAPIPLDGIVAYRCETPVEQLPTISLVTPSYNQGHFIERTIRSVLDQGYPGIEYRVQDGGSTDETVTVLKKFEGRLSGWVSNRDSGQSQAINLGFSTTAGEIMAWLNSDDILLPGSLAYVADYFVRHPEVDVVYGNRLLIDEDDMQIGRWILPGHNEKVLSWADYIPQETLFWRRSIWEKTGGRIDESFRFAMDWDLLLRFRNAGARFAHIPRFLGAFRIHTHQKTSASISEIGYAEMNRIRERELGQKVTHGQIRKAVSAFLFRHLLYDCAFSLRRRLGASFK